VSIDPYNRENHDQLRIWLVIECKASYEMAKIRYFNVKFTWKLS